MKQLTNNILSDSWPWPPLSIVIAIAVICASTATAVILELEVFRYDSRSFDSGNIDSGSFDSSGLEFTVSVTETSEGVRFEFCNDSTTASTIDGLYFEAGVLANIVTLDLGSGTFFELDENTGQLPGGNMLTPDFDTTYSFALGPPSENNGIEPGEWSAVIFNLDSEAVFEDVINQLYDGSFRVGVHISGTPGGLSTSAINTTPEPATLLLLAIGSGLFLRKKRRL
jgi:hypothetical protein